MNSIDKEKIYDIVFDWVYENMYNHISDGDYDYGIPTLEYCGEGDKFEDLSPKMIEDLTNYITEEYEKRNN